MRLLNIELHINDKINFDQFECKIKTHAQIFQIIKHVLDFELMRCNTGKH